MAMPETHHDKNGADLNFVHQLRRIVGNVRFGWAIAATALSPAFLLAALLVHNGWITTPAKDSDMKTVQAKLEKIESIQAVQTEALRTLNLASVRFEEGAKAQQYLLDKIDGKLDSIMDQHLAIMRAFVSPTNVPQKVSPVPTSPPPAPIQRPRAHLPKKHDTGLSLFR